MTEIAVTPFSATDLDWLVDQHQALYTADEGFDDSFGPLVRSILTAFLSNHDPTCEAGWIARRGNERLGSIFCVRHDQTHAKLRLFLLVPQARGLRLGRRLLDHCMAFARASDYRGMTLWTHESHAAACALYEKTGWTLTRSEPVHSFGQDLVEQTWDITFGSG